MTTPGIDLGLVVLGVSWREKGRRPLPRDPFAAMADAFEAHAATLAAERRGPAEPARPRTSARDGSQVPAGGRVTFPATVTSKEGPA